MTRFLLIRHAVTNTVGKRLSGRSKGIMLNDEGKEQAKRLAERLQHLSVTAIYSSPLERAVETAEPLAKLLQLETKTCNGLLEIDFGEWTNAEIDTLKEQPEFQKFNSFRSHTRIPGGETMLEAQVRIISTLEELCREHDNEVVAVVSHSDIIKAAVAFYAGIHLDMFHRIEISPASVSIIELFKDTVKILTVNNTDGIRF